MTYNLTINIKIPIAIRIKVCIIRIIGGLNMKNEILTADTKVQQTGTNLLVIIPASVRSVLKPSKGDTIQYVVYDDKTIEIKIVKGE